MNGDCGCRWDGNLDGKMIRCADHREMLKLEKRARKAAKLAYDREVALTHLVWMAEEDGSYL